MSYAQDLGLQTALITNGTRLDKVEQEAVRGTWLRISLDAACEPTYEITHRNQMANSWARVLHNIERVVRLREQLKTQVNIGVGFVVQQANWGEILTVSNLAYNLGVDNIRISALFTPEGPRYHQAYAKAAMEMARIAETSFGGSGFTVHNRLNEKLSDLSGPPNYARCYYQQFTTYLGADANLYRCCVQSYNPRGLLGNVVEAGGFKKLWDSIAASGNLETFDARGCQRCQFNDRNGSIAAGVRGDTKLDGPVAHPFFV
jgi:sulfatase maturation enzyme AslB (radical SAM superfamily)